MMLYPTDSELGDAVAVVAGARPELLGVQVLSDFAVVRATIADHVREFRLGRRVQLHQVKANDLFEVKW